MMMFRKFGMAAALSLAAVSTNAAAQSAPPHGTNSPALRASAGIHGESHIRGGFIIPTLVLIAIGIAVWQLTKSHSTSP